MTITTIKAFNDGKTTLSFYEGGNCLTFTFARENSISLKMAKLLTGINTSGPFFYGAPVAKGTAFFFGSMSTDTVIWQVLELEVEQSLVNPIVD